MPVPIVVENLRPERPQSANVERRARQLHSLPPALSSRLLVDKTRTHQLGVKCLTLLIISLVRLLSLGQAVRSSRSSRVFDVSEVEFGQGRVSVEGSGGCWFLVQGRSMVVAVGVVRKAVR